MAPKVHVRLQIQGSRQLCTSSGAYSYPHYYVQSSCLLAKLPWMYSRRLCLQVLIHFFFIPKLSLRKISLLVFFLHFWSSLFFSQKLHFLLRLISPELLLNYSTDLHNYFYSLSSVFCILLYLRLKFCAVTPWEARASYSTTALLVSNHCKSHNENCILTSAPALKENHCNIFLAICKQGSYFRVSNNRTYVGLNQKELFHSHVEHSNWY